MKTDLYAEITDKLIALIENNPGEPQLPWRRSSLPLRIPQNAITSRPYNGINVLSLWLAAEDRGFDKPLWATYRQWSDAGAQVRAGEKSSPIIFYKQYGTDPDPQNADDTGVRRVARASRVFNVAQVDGYQLPQSPQPANPIDHIAAVDQFITNTGANIIISGNQAYYRPSTDQIYIPEEELFTGTDTMTRSQSFASVKIHEVSHWSGAKNRLNRQFGERFGDHAYAFEELVASFSEAFLCAELHVTQSPRPDHAHYLANWLTILKNDKRALFHAAAKAAEAVTYLKTFQDSTKQEQPLRLSEQLIAAE